jgi:hypothetical protein
MPRGAHHVSRNVAPPGGLQADPRWHELLVFSEDFHGDTGAGLGASHQTGWTALVLDLILKSRQSAPAATPSGTSPAAADC